jgi:phage protein D
MHQIKVQASEEDNTTQLTGYVVIALDCSPEQSTIEGCSAMWRQVQHTRSLRVKNANSWSSNSMGAWLLQRYPLEGSNKD